METHTGDWQDVGLPLPVPTSVESHLRPCDSVFQGPANQEHPRKSGEQGTRLFPRSKRWGRDRVPEIESLRESQRRVRRSPSPQGNRGAIYHRPGRAEGRQGGEGKRNQEVGHPDPRGWHQESQRESKWGGAFRLHTHQLR